ncbi:MAG: N-6 DNA methylase, partial [Nitrospinae bacterium]|nr:N-6 DNA methylase [Nitrospinota bacterium]
MNSNVGKLETFLSSLDFDPKSDFKETDIPSKIGVDFVYKIDNVSPIYFKYLPESTLSNELLELHQKIWNENKTEVFIVVSDNKTFLCASKYKPDKDNSLKCIFKDFSYGVNSTGFEHEKLEPLLKENIDFGFFWEFVRKNIKERKRQSVDYDLLLNLIALKKDMISELPPDKSYILIERCLFLKFLEDRGFHTPPTFIDILKDKNSKKLIERFNEVNKSLNGDIYDDKTVFTQQEISANIMEKLHNFFTTDYKNKQLRLFPYRFDIISVELLSNIYEAFLKTKEQADKGIYYTPSNLVDLVLNETLEPILKKNPKPNCLDFACGSGIFLVKSFKKIIDKNNCQSDFEKKKDILKNCIFGIEKDSVATRITVFSLYLTLLEGEDPNKVKQLIKNNRIKFPKLFGKNILWNDTLFDELNFINEDSKKFNTFDVVVGNPPWGVNVFANIKHEKEIKLSAEKHQAVKPNDQSSQYFILKAEDFMKDISIAGIVFNNTNLLMKQAQPFRKQILIDYNIKAVYELTRCNSILFNKQKIENLEIGADEPAVAMIFQKKKKDDNTIKYVTPSFDRLCEKYIFKMNERPFNPVSQFFLPLNSCFYSIWNKKEVLPAFLY